MDSSILTPTITSPQIQDQDQQPVKWVQLNFTSLVDCPNCQAVDQLTDGRSVYCGICLEITELEN